LKIVPTKFQQKIRSVKRMYRSHVKILYLNSVEKINEI
jgi:hypothetical protein